MLIKGSDQTAGAGGGHCNLRSLSDKAQRLHQTRLNKQCSTDDDKVPLCVGVNTGGITVSCRQHGGVLVRLDREVYSAQNNRFWFYIVKLMEMI